MLKTQLQLFREAIDQSDRNPIGKYFESLGHELLVTGLLMETPGEDDLPEVELESLTPHEREFLEGVKEVFEQETVLNAQTLMGDAPPFEITWVVGDYILGIVVKKLI